MNGKQRIVGFGFVLAAVAIGSYASNLGPWSPSASMRISPAPSTGVPASSTDAGPTMLAAPTLPDLPPPSMLAVLDASGSSTPVDTVCVSVTEAGATEREPVASTVQEMLKQAQINMVDPGGACKADLHIQMTFTKLGANYSSGAISCFVYSGADMVGQLGLAVTGGAGFSIPLQGRVDPNQTLTSCGGSPPYGSVWPGALMDAFVKIWGAPMLIEALGIDSIGDVAVNRLENFGSEMTSLKTQQLVSDLIPRLMWTMRDGNPKARQLAARTIETFVTQAQAAIPDLIALLGDPVMEVRVAAAQTLGAFGPKAAAAAPGLIDLINTDDVFAPNIAIKTLGEIGPGAVGAVPTLTRLLRNTSAPFVDLVAVATSLGQIGPAASDAAPALMDILKGVTAPGLLSAADFTSLRVQAAMALTQMKVDVRPALSDISTLADSSDQDTQEAATKLLGLLAPTVPEAIPYLIRVLDEADSHDSYARLAAIEALGNCGPSARVASAVLRKVADDPRFGDLHSAAYVALVRIGAMQASDASTQLISLLSSTQFFERKAAAYALGDLGPEVSKAAVPALIKTLSDADDTVRWAAIFALGKMGSSAASAVPSLIPVVPSKLIDGDLAVTSLGEIGPDSLKAVPAIIDKLKKEDNESQRTHEITALKKITGQDFGANADQWAAWWQSQT
jgi:HEAT repeat protein